MSHRSSGDARPRWVLAAPAPRAFSSRARRACPRSPRGWTLLRAARPLGGKSYAWSRSLGSGTSTSTRWRRGAPIPTEGQYTTWLSAAPCPSRPRPAGPPEGVRVEVDELAHVKHAALLHLQRWRPRRCSSALVLVLLGVDMHVTSSTSRRRSMSSFDWGCVSTRRLGRMACLKRGGTAARFGDLGTKEGEEGDKGRC